jgi:hypothetical protein
VIGEAQSAGVAAQFTPEEMEALTCPATALAVSAGRTILAS